MTDLYECKFESEEVVMEAEDFEVEDVKEVEHIEAFNPLHAAENLAQKLWEQGLRKDDYYIQVEDKLYRVYVYKQPVFQAMEV